MHDANDHNHVKTPKRLDDLYFIHLTIISLHSSVPNCHLNHSKDKTPAYINIAYLKCFH